MAATVKDWKNTKDKRLKELLQEINDKKDGIRRMVMSIKPSTMPLLPPTREERKTDKRWLDFC